MGEDRESSRQKCGFSSDGLLPEHAGVSGERTEDMLGYA
jgi:hypothetical protein